jgi:hypothetical protein
MLSIGAIVTFLWSTFIIIALPMARFTDGLQNPDCLKKTEKVENRSASPTGTRLASLSGC